MHSEKKLNEKYTLLQTLYTYFQLEVKGI